MANYSLVVNSRFRPFEYQELLAPVLMATQAHQAVEEQYADLATKASIWDGLTEGSERAHRMYTDYAKALDEAADDLSKYGLNPTSRQAMLNMRTRYGKEITPIEVAYKTKNEQAKAQSERMLKDPTYRYRRRASELTLDDYLENPNLDVTNEGISGALIATQVGQAVKHLKEQLLAQGKGNLSSLGLPYQYERMLTYGPTIEDINKALRGDPDAMPILVNAVNNAIGASGVRNWEDDAALDYAKYHAGLGLYESLGKTELKNFTDDYGKSVALESLRHSHAMSEKAKEATESDILGGEPSRGWNFLEINGDLAGYRDIKGKLFNDSGSLRASYFGKNYKNPMAIYDEATKAYNDVIKRKTITSGKELEYSPELMKQTAQAGEEAERAKKAVLEKYGVTKMLTPKEYQRLKDLGYNANSTWNDFRQGYDTKVNNRAAVYQHGSVNLTDTGLKNAGDIITGYLRFADKNDKINTTLWEMNADGGKGKAIKDLKKAGIDLSKEVSLNDIFYSRQAPDLIHIQYGGADVYADPNVLGSVAAEVVKESNELLGMPDDKLKAYISKVTGVDANTFTAEDARDMITKSTTAKLRDAVRAYNKGRSNTDSSI